MKISVLRFFSSGIALLSLFVIPVSEAVARSPVISAAQGNADEGGALEHAVSLLYQLIPSHKNARVDLEDVAKETLFFNRV